MRNENEDANYYDVVPPGHSIKVPITLMDGVQRQFAGFAFDADNHRPHFAEPSDQQHQQRRSAYDAYVQRITSAWRSRPRDQEPGENVPANQQAHLRQLQSASADRRHLSFADAKTLRDSAYRTYVDELTKAWRTNRGIGR